MHSFLKNQQGKIPFKMVILGLIIIFISVSSGVFLIRKLNKYIVLAEPDKTYLYDLKIPVNYTQPLIIAVFDNILQIKPVNARPSQIIQEKENVARYIDAYQNTDVVQTRYTNKLKEDIILKQPGHPAQFEYQINTEDFLWEIDEEGNIIFRQKYKPPAQSIPSTDGSVIPAKVMEQYTEENPFVFKIPTPFLIEEKDNQQVDKGNVEVKIENNKLILIPDSDWLKNHNYPILLDPTIESQPVPVEEIATDRTFNSLTFRNNDHSYTLKAHVGYINYKNKETGKFELIDTTLIDKGDYWQQDQASYHLRAPKYADGWIEFNDMFENKNQVMKMKPVANHIAGQLVTDEDDIWQNKKVVYANAFGPGYDLELINSNIAFNKLIKINQVPDNLTQDLEFEFELELPVEAKIYTAQGEWDKQTPLRTKEQVKIGSPDIGHSYFRQFSAWDSNDNIINIEIELYQKNNKLYFKKIIPQKFLSKAVEPVYTDTTATFYAGAGDGYVEERDANWDNCHDATIGLYAGPTLAYNVARSADENGGDDWRIHRAFVPVDTSALPDAANITAATFSIYVYMLTVEDNDGYDYIRLVQTSQASTATLTTDDFEQCGAINNPTAGATDLDMSSGITNGQYNTFTLNATGLTWIETADITLLGIRQGHDAADHRITVDKENKVQFYSSEVAGTYVDPYLTVTFDNIAPTISSVIDTPDPTNPNRSVSFIVDWDDIFDSVKVKVCKAAGLTNQNCDNDHWASSTDFTTVDPLTLVYDVVAGDHGQTRNYSVYVCDDEAACSAVSSGTFSINLKSVVPDIKIRGGTDVRGGDFR